MVARALIFDCDGTLVDSMPVHYRAWCRTVEPLGLTFTEERFYSLGGVSTREILAHLAREQGVDVDIEAAARARDDAFMAMADQVRPIEPVGRRRGG